MNVKTIIDEDFNNYRFPCLTISAIRCDWKCCIEQHLPVHVCQNNPIAKMPNVNIFNSEIFDKYISNPITKAICIAGLEPMLQKDEVYELIKYFRNHNCNDDVVIYTGYYEHEIQPYVDKLKTDFKNIVIKFGRFIPNQKPHYDEVLGVYLASDNQKAVRIC